jgi:methylglutaconyl-CoA hydratase
VIEVEKRGPVERVRLDNPKTRNALSSDLIRELAEVFNSALVDPTIRVIVLGHTGGAFCSGLDLTEPSLVRPPGGHVRLAADVAALFQLILSAPKPVVCQVGGAARAAGLGLVACCDIAVGSTSATFSASEVLLGAVPALVGAVLLNKIERAAVYSLLLTGSAIDGREAHRIGLLAQVVADGDLDARVNSVVGQLLLAHPGSLALTKEIVRTVPTMRPNLVFGQMARLSDRMLGGAAAREGIAAIREHRLAEWAMVEDAQAPGSVPPNSP